MPISFHEVGGVCFVACNKMADGYNGGLVREKRQIRFGGADRRDEYLHHHDSCGERAV